MPVVRLQVVDHPDEQGEMAGCRGRANWLDGWLEVWQRLGRLQHQSPPARWLQGLR